MPQVTTAAAPVANTQGLMSIDQFVRKSIINLRNPAKSKGIHTVYSGFNQAFRKYFELNPVEVVKQLVADGKIESHFAKGGAMIYLPGDAPVREDGADKALKAILG